MVVAILIVILASFLWAITNHIDKFLVCEIDKSTNNIKTLLIFSSFVAGVVLIPIWLIISRFNIFISIRSLICIFMASIIYIFALYCYYKALENNDASVVIAIQQLIPVFSYLLALIFFKENLTIKQMAGSLVIVLSATLISFDFNNINRNNKRIALLYMTLYSFLGAIYWILFDVAMRDSSYNTCAFWFQIGLLLIGLFFLCIKSYRNSFILSIRKNGKKYLSLNIVNEFVNLIGYLLMNYANVLIPIALVNVINGFQGMFVFFLGVIGVIFMPKYFKEDISKSEIIQKVSCIILGIIGLIIIVI